MTASGTGPAADRLADEAGSARPWTWLGSKFFCGVPKDLPHAALRVASALSLGAIARAAPFCQALVDKIGVPGGIK